MGPTQPKPFRPRNDCRNTQTGSIIGCQDQTLGEEKAIVGTGFSLRYQSDRVSGGSARVVRIPLTGANVPASLRSINVEVQVAGLDVTQYFSPTANQTYTFVWDGKDVYGRVLQGRQLVTVRITYVYPAIYEQPDESEASFAGLSGVSITGSEAREEIYLSQEWHGSIGGWLDRTEGIGGWTLDIHHAYDPVGRVLYLGDGRQRSAEGIGQTMTTAAGSGAFGNFDAASARDAQFDTPAGVAVAPDGSLYIADMNNNRVRRLAPDGALSTVVGTGQACAPTTASCGDGGAAAQAQLYQPAGVAVGPDGSLYIADGGDNRVRRVAAAPDGTIPVSTTITTVAGTGSFGYSGDNGPATAAQLAYPSSVALDANGDLFIADENNSSVREVTPNGAITTVAGQNGQSCYPATATCGDGALASGALLSSPTGVAVGPDGSLYIADFFNRVRRVGPDGIITTAAGTGAYGFGGDGSPATAAQLASPAGIAIGPDGVLYIADAGNRRVRRVGPDGTITTVAGDGQDCYSSTDPCGDMNLAARAQLPEPVGVAVRPDGAFYIADEGNNRIRQVSPALQGLSVDETAIPSEDGSQIYVFDGTGRHLRTLDGLTGGVRYRFGYDPAGRLATVTDGDGNATTIEHDASGSPTAIVAPGGQRTTLATDSNGYLSGIADPLDETTALTYTATGLLTAMTDPMGNPHTFSYDDQGRLTKDQEPTGGYTTLSRVDSASGYTVTVSTALNRVTTYAEEFLSDGGQSETTIDSNGGLTVARTGPDGVQHATYPDGTSIAEAQGPDPRWGVQVSVLAAMTETAPSGLAQTALSTRTVALADPGNPLSVRVLTDTIAINGKVSTSVFDAAFRAITTTTAAGRQSVNTLDAQGRPLGRSLASGVAPITLTYDSQGRPSQEQQGTQSATYGYDARNRLVTRTDAAGRVTRYGYDGDDRVISATLPGGETYRYTYDANGNRTSVVMPNGAVHKLTYTPLDQQASYTPPGNGGYARGYDLDRALTSLTLPSGRAVLSAYDSGGRPTGLAYPDATVTFGYAGGDTTDRIGSITRQPRSGASQSLAYTYDGALTRSLTASGAAQGSYSYGYDNNFYLTDMSLTSGSDTVDTPVGRDADGLLTSYGPFTVARGGPGGVPSRLGDGTFSRDLTYDALARTAAYTDAVGSARPYKVALTYDSEGRITRKVETVAGVAHTYDYTYDANGQLTTVQRDGAAVEQYTYDGNGNRTSRQVGAGAAQTASYDAQDRLTGQGGVAYTVDTDGYLARRGADTFQYSARGELITATVGGATVTYAYDGLGRRVARTDGAGTTQYLYGNPSALTQVTAVRDPSGALTILYYDEQGLLIALQRGGARYYVATDQIGTPRVVTDAAGSVVKTIDYDSYGDVTATGGGTPGFALPVGFADGLSDAATGLVNFGFRDYDPATGRWTARDPVLYAGAQANLYVYVGNDPISLRDPLGLWCVGGSAYEGIGGGSQICNDGKNTSLCFEVGVGVGASIDLSANAGTASAGGESFAEASVTCGPISVSAGIKLSRCGVEVEGKAAANVGGGSTYASGGYDFGGKSGGGFSSSTGVQSEEEGTPSLGLGKCSAQGKLGFRQCSKF